LDCGYINAIALLSAQLVGMVQLRWESGVGPRRGEDAPAPAGLAPLPVSSRIPPELGTARQGRRDLHARQVLGPRRDAELHLALSSVGTILCLSARSPAGVSVGRIFPGRQR